MLISVTFSMQISPSLSLSHHHDDHHHYQDTKERGPKRLQRLQRNHAAVSPWQSLNRILLERKKTTADSKLHDNQADIRQDRSCTDHITTLHIVIEQSLGWSSSPYVNFIDYDKAFDSVDRETHWKLLGQYGIPKKIISLIQCRYQGMFFRAVLEGQLQITLRSRLECIRDFCYRSASSHLWTTGS